MKKPITAFLPFGGAPHTMQVVAQLRSSGFVGEIYLLTTKSLHPLDGCKILRVDSLWGSKTLQMISGRGLSPYTLLLTEDVAIEFGQFGIERFLTIAESTGSGMVYADFYEVDNGRKSPHPVGEYQAGSIRDDFNFGPVLLFNAGRLKEAVRKNGKSSFNYAGLYSTRLALSRRAPITRIAEFLYANAAQDAQPSSERKFDYVDRKNREVQIEMELAATQHLKYIRAFLGPKFKRVNFARTDFEYEVSVIIPVKNRVRTIADAVHSALNQKAEFQFNIIIVDNRSSDGTTEVLRSLSLRDKRIVHIIPIRDDLGIGGCWNEAVHYSLCGRFAVQLDSDDLYEDETVLQRIVNVFRRERCAMVIGSYKLVDFDLHTIPPGLIDHREWTPGNGPNNALRVNGLGAPRAFYTPVLRTLNFPNVSYGEDYSMALAISREYRIGRIYEPIYLCRRWEGNSDAQLDVEKQNAFDFYKDKVRTLEILARQRLVSRKRSTRSA